MPVAMLFRHAADSSCRAVDERGFVLIAFLYVAHEQCKISMHTLQQQDAVRAGASLVPTPVPLRAAAQAATELV